VKTKKEAGQVTVKMIIPLVAYAGEPVSVRLDDGDTQPIARRILSELPASGGSGALWKFKSKADGIRQVQLKNLGAKHPGEFQLAVKAQRWFSAAAANDAAANTRITVTIGGQCFTHAATKKSD
jgi:hypothetical protein